MEAGMVGSTVGVSTRGVEENCVAAGGRAMGSSLGESIGPVTGIGWQAARTIQRNNKVIFKCKFNL
jgi:hypothetical protein